MRHDNTSHFIKRARALLKTNQILYPDSIVKKYNKLEKKNFSHFFVTVQLFIRDIEPNSMKCMQKEIEPRTDQRLSKITA